MQKGLLTRFIIHNILKSLKNKNISFETVFNEKIENYDLSVIDKKLIFNVVLNSMRKSIKIDKIINCYTKKIKNNGDEYFLLLSSITQIIYLNFKDYAVINTTVELTKNKQIRAHTPFINGVLRNILRDKKKLLEIKTNFNDLPKWFVKRTKTWNKNQKKIFLETIELEPDLHLVFKNANDLQSFKTIGKKTTTNSIVVKNSGNIEDLPDYGNGNWWIQDFSAMLPLYFTANIQNKTVIDMCAAPGGKSFQLLAKKGKLVAFDKDKQRSILMKENLKRLNYDQHVNVGDSLKINNKKKFDIVLIDAPCTSIGTIRRNPEIFFRPDGPNIKKIMLMQSNFLEKAKLILNNKGMIIYIVCSFLYEEGENQISQFLQKNKNFKIQKFLLKELKYKELINNKGFFITLPINFQNRLLIDGFFAAKLIRND